jgi:hypothetical protein
MITLVSNLNSVNAFVEETTKGTFGIQLLAVTEPAMNKKGNPFFGRVKKATYLANVALGYDYENCVNIRLEKQGSEPNFTTQPPKGRRFINDFILEKIKDTSVKYLRTTMNGGTTEKHCYFLDDKEVTDASLLAEIDKWIIKPSVSAKQARHGLVTNQVIVRDFTISNIVALQQGNDVYFVGHELDLDKYLSLF